MRTIGLVTAALPTALRATRPLEAALVGAPALAGWVFAGGPGAVLAGAGPADGALVALGAWALALAAFAFNDRVDVRVGVAHLHRRRQTRALARIPGAPRALAALGVTSALLGLACFALLGVVPFCAAVVVATAAWLYSDPVFFGKGRPVPASVLHLLGGGALAFAGAQAVSAAWPPAVAWGLSCAAVFGAAHLVHQVAGRDEDRAAGVETLVTGRPPRAAAGTAVSAVLAALALTVAAGLVLGRPRGAALVAWGLWSAAWIALLARPALADPEGWSAFQRRARWAVASGVGIGLLLASLVEIDG